MDIKNILQCGYTFTEKEYELETRYVMMTVSLLTVSGFLLILATSYYFIGDIDNVMVNILGSFMSLFFVYAARKVGKDQYVLLIYVLAVFFSVLVMYDYYLSNSANPIESWIILLVLGTFLILNAYVGIFITFAYIIFILFMNGFIIEESSTSYILLKITPVFFGLVLIFLIEKKFRRLMDMLEESNSSLEKRVQDRTNDIEDEKNRLDYQAHYDCLTNLPNRNKFHQEIQEWIKRHSRMEQAFSLFFIDLDRFKRVNDSLGHAAGDQVLQIIGRRIRENVSPRIFLARISGDEFTLLVPYEDDSKEVKELLKRVIEIIEEPIVIDENRLYISASIGVSSYPRNSVLDTELIKYADITMFEAKKEGSGVFKFYEQEMKKHVEKRVLMEAEMHSALENKDFELHYQPQVDNRTGKLSGLETLVRWKHAKLGFVSPAVFIPLAEDTGLIVELDFYILKEGMKQVVKWHNAGFKIPVVSFNFSTKHLEQKGFVDTIKLFLTETGCKGEWIELEITESHIVSSINQAVKVLNLLRELNIEIAIDDFGTGYSSLTYLRQLPADKLKIDKSFIDKITENGVDRTIVQAIIDIGNSLNLTVIAEGVENKEQNDYLLAHNCYHIQGWFYYKAMNATQLEEEVYSTRL